MRVTETRCDRCQATISRPNHVVRNAHRDTTLDQSYDLCDTCNDQFGRFIANADVKAQTTS